MSKRRKSIKILSFGSGVVSVLSLGAAGPSFRVPSRPSSAPSALAQDWANVGGDFRSVIVANAEYELTDVEPEQLAHG